jgi:phosphate:Na+ symporter
MTGEILNLLGGIGLFLFGMQTMTAALGRLASRRARAVLAKFTTTPFTGVLTGAATTAAIQSSSATVMTVIGFVGAGLMAFPQAIGVVFGANIGTTVTGWMVAILGLKLKIGILALPLLFGASFLALLGRGARAQVGLTLSGFALVFVGLDMMQGAIDAVTPYLAALPEAGGLGGRLLLVLIGAGVTAIVQSSSVSVAATLVLLSGGAIGLMQAAALVIGMDIGTTFKSLLATLGGARDMRRTAWAHVGYNLVTGFVAFLLLGLVPLLGSAFGDDLPTALVVFHTGFNLVGVLLMLPFVRAFARFIERLVPGEVGPLPEPLDRRLLVDPHAALDAARASAGAIAAVIFRALAARLGGAGPPLDDPGLRLAIEDLEDFTARIALPSGSGGPRHRYSALLHLTDHLYRLLNRAGQERRVPPLRTDRALRRPARAFAAALVRAADRPSGPAMAARLTRLHRLTAGRTARLRRSVLLREHAGLVSLADVFALTDALRWLERSFHHAERIVHYGAVAAEEEPTREAAAREAAPP